MQMPECNGHVCLFTCRDFANTKSSKDERSIIVPYNYEVYVPTTLSLHIELQDALRKVESLMLEYTARRLGLEGCKTAIDQFNFDDSVTDWIYDDISIDQNDAIISSIASAPADKVDESKDQCIITSIDETPEGSICFPINGFMRVRYAGDENIAPEVSKAIINVIGLGLKEGHFVTEWIEKIDISVTGNEIVAADLHEINQVGGIGNDTSPAMSGTGIGIIVTACAAVIAGTALLIRKTFRGKKKTQYIRTPSPNAGKKSGLRAYDSESVRADFDDVCFNLESCKRKQLDPYELDPEAPSILLETNLNNINRNTALSTISEASKETGSTKSGARVFAAQGLVSPPSSAMQSFTRILSESTYSDGVYSLDHSNMKDEYEEYADYTAHESLHGKYNQSPSFTPNKSREE